MANNLMDYLPDYYNDVYEMQAIMHAQVAFWTRQKVSNYGCF